MRKERKVAVQSITTGRIRYVLDRLATNENWLNQTGHRLVAVPKVDGDKPEPPVPSTKQFEDLAIKPAGDTSPGDQATPTADEQEQPQEATQQEFQELMEAEWSEGPSEVEPEQPDEKPTKAYLNGLKTTEMRALCEKLGIDIDGMLRRDIYKQLKTYYGY